MAPGRFVVGFDGSDGSRDALRWALTAAAVDGSPVEAVAVWTLPAVAAAPFVPTAALDHQALSEEFEASIRAELEAVRASVPDAAPVELRVLEGPAGPTLVEASAGAHCLVVGRRGLGGFAGLLLGSVADHCLQHATVPVVVVPRDGGREVTGRVVVGIDGSAHSANALRWAAAEARRQGRQLVALYAWTWLDQPGEFDPGFDAEAAKRYATDFAAEALGDDAKAEIEVDNDLPARALLARSEAGDLVVLGSRGMGAVRRALLGSVSRAVSHHAAAPVVVVPHHDAHQD